MVLRDHWLTIVATAFALAAGAEWAHAAEETKVAALSPDEISRETAEARPVDLSTFKWNVPKGAAEIEVGYDVHIGGFRLVEVTMRAMVHDGTYVATTALETKGLAEAFSGSDIEAIATGNVDRHVVRPVTYNSDQRERSKRQLVGLLFKGAMPQSIASDPPYDLDRFPVPSELKANTVDPLSAALFLFLGSSANSNEPCGTLVPVFDGRRRYNIRLSFDERVEEISLGRKGAYKGPALRCTAQYERVAGFKPPKPGKKPTAVPPLSVWLAPFGNGEIMIPVRLQAESDFGAVVARAVRLKVVSANQRG